MFKTFFPDFHLLLFVLADWSIDSLFIFIVFYLILYVNVIVFICR